MSTDRSWKISLPSHAGALRLPTAAAQSPSALIHGPLSPSSAKLTHSQSYFQLSSVSSPASDLGCMWATNSPKSRPSGNGNSNILRRDSSSSLRTVTSSNDGFVFSYHDSKVHTKAAELHIPGYSDLQPIHPNVADSVSMYRSTCADSGQPVLVKLSPRGSLEDITRIRHEWNIVYSDSKDDLPESVPEPLRPEPTETLHYKPLGRKDSAFNFPNLDMVPGILRPETCIRTSTSQLVLVYPDHHNLKTLRERFIEQARNEHVKDQPGPRYSLGSREPFERRQSKDLAVHTNAQATHVLQVMLDVVKTISQVHKHGITHHGLTSSTIYIDDHDRTFISGWDFSFPLRAEDMSRGYRKAHLKQNLDYMGYASPETTGMANRLADYRTDFYSLGCIMHELLLGFLPFCSDDPMELAHMHLLRTPAAPSSLADWVPECLSQVLLKLLEKNAYDRYPSANHLVLDLEQLIEAFDGTSSVVLGPTSPTDVKPEDDYLGQFTPAAHPSVAPVFMVPQLIYGREKTIDMLNASFERGTETGFQFVFCTGEPGSGKSRLVHELQRSLISRDTFFCVSKFDSYQRGAPFYSIVTALKQIVHHIMSSSSDNVLRWRKTMIQNLKVELAVLFAPIPELMDLLGRDYIMQLNKPKSLGPVPQEMRFKFVVKSLFSLLATHGVTVFLDDIHWCPATELALFRELITFGNERHAGDLRVTFICAAVPGSHWRYESLVQLARDLELKHCHIDLDSLSFEAVKHIVEDTLAPGHRTRGSTEVMIPCKGQKTPTQAQALSELVYEVTKGNPLFVDLVLKFLYYEGHIFFDGYNHITGGKWKVDFETLDGQAMPQSITDAVITMVHKLPPETVRILQYAACICSNTFTLEDLAVGADVSFSEAARALYPALELQLLLPQTIHYKFPFGDPVGTTNISLYDEEIRQVAGHSSYKFYHDLVQQAVYSTLDERASWDAHRTIGLRLLGDDHTRDITTHKVIEIANQLKNSVPIVQEHDRQVYIDLNVRAGAAVYSMSDFDMAYGYYKTAHQLIGEDVGNDDPEKLQSWKDIVLNLVELLYNRKCYKECLAMVSTVFERMDTNLDRVLLLRTKTKALYGLCRTDDAISTGLEALALLGFHLKEDEEWNRANHESLRPRIPMGVPEIRQLVNLQPTQDAGLQLFQDVVAIITVPVILSSRHHLFRSLVYTSVIAFVDHGTSASGLFSLLSLASLLQSDGGSANLTRAFEYSKLAIVTMDCYDTTIGLDFGINIYEYYALTLAIYFEPLSEVIKYYELVLSSGQTFEDHCGMLSLSYDLRPLCKYLAGEPLDRVFDHFKAMRPVTIQPGDETGLLWIQAHQQAMYNMMDETCTDPSSLEGHLLQSGSVHKILTSHSAELKHAYYVVKLSVAVMYRQKYVAAEIICQNLPALIPQVPITVYHVMLTFCGALAIIDKDNKTPQDQAQLQGFVRDLENWSKCSPSTFTHKYLMVKAEADKHVVNSIVTLDAYEDAIRHALDEGYLHEAALINERCGEFVRAHSKQRSDLYLSEACRLYTMWGAKNKVVQLNLRFPNMTTPSLEVPRLSLSSTDLSSGSLISDLRSRSTLNSNNVVIQNTSPLRWIFSNLFDGGGSGGVGAIRRASVVDSEDQDSTDKDKRDEEMNHTFELKSSLQACLDISESVDMDLIISRLVESVMVTTGADYCVFISADDAGFYVECIGSLGGITLVKHESIMGRAEVAPLNVLYQVMASGSPVTRASDTKRFDAVYGRENYYLNRLPPEEVLCVPIQNQTRITGVLYLEHHSDPSAFSMARIQLIALLATQAAVSLDKARLYHQMDLAKKAAEESMAEKASFLANMSHEIRTPFNALLSCSIFLLDTDLSEIQREYVDTIRNSSQLTLNIIDAILAFSKIEHGSITLDNTPFSLRECVESAIQLITEPAATKDLELVHLNKCGEIDLVSGDATRVRQIIINLLGNAVKFTSSGRIVVETSCEKVSSGSRYEFTISVLDTGIGIPPSAKSKIFQAFSQVDGSSRRVYGGSGLGLAISKKLAELMGGSLSFDSKENEGTTFWFNLVATAQEVEGDGGTLGTTGMAGTLLPRMMYKGRRCLVVDGRQTAREALVSELRRLGFLVSVEVTAQLGLEAVQTRAAGHFALVLVDSKLMDIGSCTETRTMKAHSAQTQIIFMSIFGRALPEPLADQGIASILLRPAPRLRLHQIISKVLSGDSPRPSTEMEGNMTKDKSKVDIRNLASTYPLKILLAEDNLINTRVALQHLRRMGYAADHAQDGVEVLSMCAAELQAGKPMYDCILMDIQMPQKDGIATAKELRALYGAESKPYIIALTANATGEDRQMCLEAGMNEYIPKPILPNDLAMALKNID